MVNDIQTELMGKSLGKILGKSSLGTVAFIRCLHPQVVRDLCASLIFVVPGWSIFGVVDHTDVEHRLITADQAVAMREEKDHNILFLIDVKTAGAGMDGVYSASREVGEVDLFEVANDLVRKRIPKGYQGIAKKAVSKARRVGGQNTVSPWREFEFYSSCLDVSDVGTALTKLGLWPIQFDDKPDVSDLEKSTSTLST